MSAIRTINTTSVNLLARRRRHGSRVPVFNSYRVHGRRFLSNNHGLTFKIRSADSSKDNRKMDMTVHDGSAGSSPGPSSNWKSWILGTLLSIILPFWRVKWAPFLAFKREVDRVVETMDTVAEVVEKVAVEVVKAADEIADSLPEGGKLKDAVCFVENVAKEVAKDAHKADEFLDKMVEIEEEVEKEVETLMEPVAACINKENGAAMVREEEEEKTLDEEKKDLVSITTINNNEEK